MPIIYDPMDGPYTRQFNEGEIQDGWFPWFEEDTSCSPPILRPEYKKAGGETEGPNRARSGHAQQWFKWGARHNAGVYRLFQVPSGVVVTVSAYAMAWTSPLNDPAENGKPMDGMAGSYFTTLGVHPFGGTVWNSGEIVWTKPPVKHGPWPGNVQATEWQRHTLSLVSQAPYVTVFLRGWPEWGLRNENCYWDDVTVSYESPGGPGVDVSVELQALMDAHNQETAELNQLLAAREVTGEKLAALKAKLGL